MHRAPLNELRPVHHEAVFGAPGLSVPEKGVSGTEYPSCTVEACFLHRMPQKMRRVPEEAFLSTARIFRTVGGPCCYRISQMPERRKVLPAPNLSNCQKREGHCPEHVPECRREQENHSRHPQNTNALHNLPVTTATHPTTSIHSHLPSHHSYTPQLHTRPTKSTSSIHSHPPGCPKSPLLKVQSACWAILQGVELTEGVLLGNTNPRAQKKKPRLNVTSIGTSEKRQLPTLPPGGAVPSALVSLTSLFGMGRGGSSPL